MFHSFKAYTSKPTLALACGATLFLAAASWELWSLHQLSSSAAAPPGAPVQGCGPKGQDPETPVALKPPAPEVARTPHEEVLEEQEETSILDTLTKKDPPGGKAHDSPSELLKRMVRQLHDKALHHFINMPGMGRMRMEPMVTVMPRAWKTPWWSLDELEKETPLQGATDMKALHRSNLMHFAESNTLTPEQRLSLNPQRHPATERLWEIKSLDLVGLVVHEQPVVYLSEKLPPMQDVSKLPTRPLDYFELVGLEHLMKGGEVFTRSKEGTVRVLGAIRAAGQCMQCHGDARAGDLLGAFSYTLRSGDYRIPNMPGSFNRGNVKAKPPQPSPLPQ